MYSITSMVELTVPELSLLRDVVFAKSCQTYKLAQDLDDSGRSSLACLTLETMHRLVAINEKFAVALAYVDPEPTDNLRQFTDNPANKGRYCSIRMDNRNPS